MSNRRTSEDGSRDWEEFTFDSISNGVLKTICGSLTCDSNERAEIQASKYPDGMSNDTNVDKDSKALLDCGGQSQ